ncbi:MAG TPA: DUF2058 family protein [Rhodanobacteraceae bacterium]|nr:DUF2058 family protein [Rhodanobacteraceae bacterium]
MSDSLREQLLKAGFAPSRKEPSRVQEKRGRGGKATPSRGERTEPPQPKRGDEVDLARAYAIRAQAERAEREAAQRQAQQQAQERRERKRRLQELLQGQSLNLAEAEHVRHFGHAGKIRRVYVSPEQLVALNRGELGVVMQAGRFILVSREVALRVKDIAEDAVALLVGPEAASATSEDGVPDDLMW